MIGVYCIKNINDNKTYIGKSIHVEKRIIQHKRNLINNKHSNRYLQNAWNKYGEDSFVFEIIEICDELFLSDREIHWIDHYNTFKDGYNLTLGGEGTSGRALSNETKDKIRKKAIGRIVPDNVKKAISEKLKGRPSHCVRYGKEHHLFGKTPSDETRMKISKANKGKVRSDGFRKCRQELTEGSNNPMALYTYVFDESFNLLFKSDTIKESAQWLVDNNYCNTINTALDRIGRNKNKNVTYKGLKFLACKIFENDVESLKEEWFEIVGK